MAGDLNEFVIFSFTIDVSVCCIRFSACFDLFWNEESVGFMKDTYLFVGFNSISLVIWCWTISFLDASTDYISFINSFLDTWCYLPPSRDFCSSWEPNVGELSLSFSLNYGIFWYLTISAYSCFL